MIKEKDQNNSWNYTYAPVMRPLRSSDDRIVPGTWLSVEKKKPWKKIKKKRDKMSSFVLQEEVSLMLVIISVILGCRF
jgi:hypothetical protein